MKKSLYGGFTLIEMVVVMGILILLMAIGIGAGRLALNNAADTAHQASVKQIYEAAMAYYSTKGSFPSLLTGTGCTTSGASTLPCLVTNSAGPLFPYIESFDGGNDTTYYYMTDTNEQYVLICALIGGQDTANARGAVCEGNGFGILRPNGTVAITKKKMSRTADSSEYRSLTTCNTTCMKGNYTGKSF